MENTTTLPVFDTTAPYHIKREYYRDGFAAFQKKFVMKRNYVMMALFFILLVSFVVSAVADPSNKTAYFLMMICLAAIFMLWYNPRKQRRMVLDAVQELESSVSQIRLESTFTVQSRALLSAVAVQRSKSCVHSWKKC